MPSLGKAREAARMRVCMSNQRQVTIAANLYSSENEGVYVGDFNSAPSTMFFATKYLPYLGGDEYTGPLDFDKMDLLFAEMEAYQCPSAKYDDVVLDFTPNAIDMEHNRKTGGYRGTWTHKLAKLPKEMSNIAYLVESNNQKMHNDASNYNLWDIWKPQVFTFNAAGNPNGTNASRSFSSTDQQHYGKMNVSFFDGHSEVRQINNSSLPFSLFNGNL